MTKSKYIVPQTYVKNLAIQLPENYKLTNIPFGVKTTQNEEKKNGEPFFIGRKTQINKFSGFLNSSNKGVFLVTGYRGMGKTSFVSQVLSKYIKKNKDKKKKVVPIHLTLAQSNPREFDVLRQIVNSIHDKYEPKLKHKIEVFLKLRNCLLFSLGALILVKYLIQKKIFSQPNEDYFDSISLLLFLLISLGVLQYLYYHFTKKNKAYNRLKSLLERCNASITKEEGIVNNYGGINELLGKITSKNTKSFPMADNKIIEYELNEFLKDVKEENIEFIFIFDELDKIDLNQNSFNPHEDMDSFEARNLSQNNLLRNRKEAILSIITSLKNFFTTADARFIFIAGREMFDASLADIADKQSPLGSIFTYTFHIESLLKEESSRKGEKNKSSLTIVIQEFLKYQFFTKECITNQNISFKKGFRKASFYELVNRYFFATGDNSQNEKYKQFYFVLQAFETYLAYRSSGSPKKLIKAFQEFVYLDRKDFKSKEDAKFETTTIITRNSDCQSKNFLYFNFNNQYRIGFINSIYRPFLIQNGRNYKTFSENTIIGIPYLFDQIFKFHPFAFSLSSLEYIPEILTSSRTPSIRKDLNQVITYLYQSYIRDTDIQLFDYKFKSKTTNEIIFISRIFEEEAAAFNFTLDESFPIKNILIEKIKELRSIHSKFLLDSTNYNQQLFSIANFNANLADLYFFDQEFDDAITCYSDAIRSINNMQIDKMNHRDFIHLIRNKLKLGLCFEKISSYEDALAFYSDSIMDIKRFFNFYLKHSNYISFDQKDETKEITSNNQISELSYENNFFTSSMNDVLQICIQSFIANLYIQEKMGLEGITTPKTKMEFSDFFRIIDEISFHSGRNNMIISNCLYHHANLLYYKNTAMPTPETNKRNPNEYPEWYKNRKDKLREYFHFKSDEKLDTIQTSRRQPYLALKTYLLGLDEVMRSKKYFTKGEELDLNDLLFKPKKVENLSDSPLQQVVDENSRAGLLNIYLEELHSTLNHSKENTHKYSSENFSSLHYKYFASYLSSIGNCIFSLREVKNGNVETNSKVKIDITTLFLYGETDFYKSLETKTTSYFDFSHVLKCYYLSAQFFERFGRVSSAIIQYRKIIHTLMLITETIKKDEPEKMKHAKLVIELVEKQIFDKAKSLFHTGAQQTATHMKNKINDDFKKANTHFIKENNIDDNDYIKFTIHDEVLEYSVAGISEIKELRLLFEQLKLNLLGYTTVKELYENKQETKDKGLGYDDMIGQFINPYSSISAQYLRLTELDFYVKYLYKKIEGLLDKSKTGKDDEKQIKKDVFDANVQLFYDYIHSKYSIIRILKIYETDYMLGPGYLAYVHSTLYDLLSIKVIEPTKEATRIGKNFYKNDFKTLNGKDSRALLTIDYHKQCAIDSYTKAIELHTTRMHYRNQIKEMIYLEDDFNDNNYHFGAAIERYLMINDLFSNKIDELNKKANYE